MTASSMPENMVAFRSVHLERSLHNLKLRMAAFCLYCNERNRGTSYMLSLILRTKVAARTEAVGMDHFPQECESFH
jgi:hypothetical protein